MSLKIKINYWIDRFFLQWRAMGNMKYLPFAFLYVLIPISTNCLKKIDSVSYLDYYEQQLEFFMPLFAAWWIVLIIQQYVEGEGKELLHIEKCSKVWDAIIFFLMYLLTVFPIIVYIENIMPRADIIIPILLTKCFLFASVIYFFSIVTRNISIGIILDIMFALFFDGRFGILLEVLGLENIISVFGYLLIGSLLFAWSVIVEKRKWLSRC